MSEIYWSKDYFSSSVLKLKEYEETKKEVMAELKKELRPEFINRIDEIIVFHKLNDNEIGQIIDIMLKEVVNRLKEQKYDIELEPEVKEMVAKEGIDKNFGARPLRRTIQNLVEDKIAEAILDGVVKKGKEASVDCDGDEVVIKWPNWTGSFCAQILTKRGPKRTDPNGPEGRK